MASTKVVSVIVNRTSHVLVVKVGNQSSFAKLATIGVGGEYKVEIDVNWTYQQYSLEPALNSGSGGVAVPVKSRIFVNSDDCCDFERIIVTQSGGKLQMCKVPRGQAPVIETWRSFFVTWTKLIDWRRFWFR